MIAPSKGSPVSLQTLRETADAMLVVVGGDGLGSVSVQDSKNAIPDISGCTTEVLI